MKMYITFTKAALVAILASVLLIIGVGGEFYAASVREKDADTNAKRVSFALGVGCVVREECISQKKTAIPEKFSDVYQNYNALQKAAGYDLLPYSGSEVTVYTYEVITCKSAPDNSDLRINLIVYNGRIIGGDISSVKIDGFMLPLKTN